MEVIDIRPPLSLVVSSVGKAEFNMNRYKYPTISYQTKNAETNLFPIYFKHHYLLKYINHVEY